VRVRIPGGRHNDGKLDLVGARGTALGKGNGEFGTPIPLPSSVTGIMAMSPGDFDGSGHVALAVATNTYDPVSDSLSVLSAYVYVLSGDGKGAFQVSSQRPVRTAQTLTAADLNGDGLADLLYTTSEINTATSLQADVNLGHGVFSNTHYDFTSSFLNFAIVNGDFDQDGNQDVVLLGEVPNGGDLTLMPGVGGGALGAPAYYQGYMGSAVVLDINGNGAPDLAGTNNVGVLRVLNTANKGH
jgi:FG-GAP-like repeat